MKLQKREKVMLGAVAGADSRASLIVFVMTGDSCRTSVLLKDKETIKVELEKKQKEKRQADEDACRLADWKQRSLPSEPSIARSLYRIGCACSATAPDCAIGQFTPKEPNRN